MDIAPVAARPSCGQCIRRTRAPECRITDWVSFELERRSPIEAGDIGWEPLIAGDPGGARGCPRMQERQFDRPHPRRTGAGAVWPARTGRGFDSHAGFLGLSLCGGLFDRNTDLVVTHEPATCRARAFIPRISRRPSARRFSIRPYSLLILQHIQCSTRRHQRCRHNDPTTDPVCSVGRVLVHAIGNNT